MKKLKYVFLYTILFFVILALSPFQIIRVVNNSMENTLHDGDLVIVYTTSDVKVGDIIAFEREGALYLKRLIGIEGDRIRIREGLVSRNGKVLAEPYLGSTDNFIGNYIVPEGCNFVLGDNRAVSNDSRFSIGYIKNSEIIGKVVIK